MSLLRGTIKSKFGITRQFKELSLDQLDFTNREDDYLLDDLEGIDELPAVDNISPENSKKRFRDDDMVALEENLETSAIKKEKVDNLVAGAVPIKLEGPQGIYMETYEVNTGGLATLSTQVDQLKELLFLQKDSQTSTGEPLLAPHEIKTEPEECCTDDESTDDCDTNNNSDANPDRNPAGNSEWKKIFPDEFVTVDEVIEKLENIYLEERDLVVRADGFISTPLHALKTLASKFNENIHHEISQIDIGESKPLARVELFAGVFRGVGESFNHRLAAQMAAIDILMRMEKLDLAKYLVPYAMFPGWRVRPRVLNDLMMLCTKNGLKLPRYHTKSNLDEPEKPVCLVECYIGKKLVSRGESDLSSVARKLAAYNAIEFLTGEKYPLEYAALGTACLSYSELVAQKTVPTASDKKIHWMLDDSSKLCNQIRGIDVEELEALKHSIYKHEMEAIQESVKNFKITFDIDSNDESTRKVKVD